MADDKIDLDLNIDSKNSEKNIDNVSKSTNSLNNALKNVAAVGAAAFAGLSAFVSKSLASYSKQEGAVNALNQSLANQGLYSKELSRSYQQLASEMQKVTLFGDEEVVSAQATIQQYIGKTKVSRELVKATLDLGQKLGSLDSAAELVGKSIGSSTNALGRYGVSTDEAKTNSEKMTAVIKGLNGQFGGLATAAAKGTGSIKQMTNIVDDIYEVFGLQFMPVLRIARSELSKLTDIFDTSPGVIQSYRDALEGVIKSAAVLKNIVTGLGGVIGASFARAGDYAKAASQVISGNFYGAAVSVKDAMGDIGEIVESSAAGTIKDLQSISEEFAKNEEDLAAVRAEAKNKKAEEDQKAADAKFQATVEEYDNLALAVLIGEEKLRSMSKTVRDQTIKDQQAFFSTVATLQNAKNKELAMIGKAAAVLQIAIATPPAVASSFRFGAQIAGPALGAVFAGIAATAMAAQAATIAGIKVAKGGFADGGSITSGLASVDNVPAILERGEFVAPKETAQSIIDARARELAGLSNGGGMTEIILSMKDDFANFFEAKILERRANGVSAI